MTAHELANLLAPFSVMESRSALSEIHRVIELSPDGLRACSSFAILERDTTDLGITDTVYVDCAALIGVVKSLPTAEIKLTVEGNALAWQCGSARGKLATLEINDMPEIEFGPIMADKQFGNIITSDNWKAAFELGALSCDPAAIGRVGLYGVMLDNDGTFTVCATDNVTISSCVLEGCVTDSPTSATIPPGGAELFNAVIEAGGQFWMSSNQCGYVSPTNDIRCAVRYIQPLLARVRDIRAQYHDPDNTIPIDQDRIKAFINRANALTANRRNMQVIVRVEDGALNLSFDEGAAASDEYFLSEDLAGFPEVSPVSISAARIARALAHIDTLALDFMDRSVLVLIGGAFQYMIGGRSGEA